MQPCGLQACSTCALARSERSSSHPARDTVHQAPHPRSRAEPLSSLRLRCSKSSKGAIWTAHYSHWVTAGSLKQRSQEEEVALTDLALNNFKFVDVYCTSASFSIVSDRKNGDFLASASFQLICPKCTVPLSDQGKGSLRCKVPKARSRPERSHISQVQ